MCVASNQHGHATIVINNCGVRNSGNVVDLAPDAIERACLLTRTMGANVMSHFWTIKAFLPTMLERGRGHIVRLC